MQLADAKHCWLCDVWDVPATELPLWIAYYNLQERARRKAERQARRQGASG